MNTSFEAEEERIAWRQRLMNCGQEGADWLLHVAKLYDHNERLIGPHHIGLPISLQKAMAHD